MRPPAPSRSRCGAAPSRRRSRSGTTRDTPPPRPGCPDPARWPLYHVKDKTWRDRKETQPWENWEDVGPGSIDFPQIFDSGDGRGLDKHYVIEHDWPQFSHPDDESAELKTAFAGVEYLKNVRW